MKYLLPVIFLFAATFAMGQQNITPGKCTSYKIDGNQVVFSCENQSKVMLQFCSRSVVKVWYAASGDFKRTNPSWAVINEKLEDINNIIVEEQDLVYEIFTDYLRVRIDKNPFRLQIFDKYQKLLMSDLENNGLVITDKKVSSHKVLRADEQFFGLGEKSGSLNRRGKSYRMWNSDKPCYSPTEDPLYKSIPFFISSYRYGIFFDNTFKSEFKFGSETSNQYSFESPGGDLVYYFIFGNDYKQIISRYTSLTGNPIMPPKWAFGFSQSRGLLTREDLSLDIAKGFRDREIPCDIIYQDIGWTQFLQDFEWRKESYQNPKQMLATLKDNGFKVIVSQDPVVSKANEKQWKEADALGHFATDSRTGKSYDMPWPWGGDCGVVDFTKPAVADWWGKLQQKPIDDGVSGFWTDMGEPAWSNEESTDRLFMKHAAGMHNEVHNIYGLAWDKVVTEQFEKRNPNKRVFQMTRAGFAGLQRYTFGWSGDAGNGNDVLDGWAQLANQIQIGQSAGMGLIPFWSCDISGYCGDITNYEALGELYLRWLQFGVFNPISRAHHEGNNAVEPWLFGLEVEAASKQAIELKYKLFPYIYTYAREAFDTGIPLMRAMMLEYPNDPQAMAAEAQFLLGKELLVAPVVEKGAETKHLYLPEGVWIDFNDGKTEYKGSRWIDYPVTLTTIPVFVKKGSIIPTMPVMQYIHEKRNYPITLKLYLSTTQSATFELYEDDGETNNYKQNISSKTTITSRDKADHVDISLSDRLENGYKPDQRNFIIEMTMTKKPKSISIADVKLKSTNATGIQKDVNTDFSKQSWSWDNDRKICTLRIPDTGKKTEIIILK